MAKVVRKIEIYGYKSIAECKLPLKPLNVLIGANGAGKSNFISVFRLLNRLVQEELQNFVAQQGGASHILHFGGQTTDEITFKFSFGRNGYSCTLKPTDDDGLFFADEIVSFLGPGYTDPYIEHLPSGTRETNLLSISRSIGKTVIADHVIEAFRSWQVYHFHDTSHSAKVKQTGEVEDNKFLRPDASNLAAFLFFLNQKHLEHYRRIVYTVRLIAPFFKDFALQPSRLNDSKIRLEWNQQGSDIYLDASQLSDGTLRMISLATLLLQPNPPATILIDEPELGLHPYAIEVLSSLLKAASTKSQIIISTQSVPLVDTFDAVDIVVVNQKDGVSRFERVQEEELEVWLENYSLGEIWAKNLIGARPGA